MFVQSNRLALDIIYLLIGVHAAFAWLPPERCDQKKATDSSSVTKSVPTVGNITEIAANQNKMLNETYKNDKFFGVPISGYYRGCLSCDYEMYAPNSCTFHTYKPRLLSSVYCQDGVACKLGHTVSTVETYAAAEGYNWGAKVSTKASFFGKMFEVGGEASTGGTYTCTYTKSRTITDNVECSVSDGKGRTLQLYNVQSDLECQFSTIKMVAETRSDKWSVWAPLNYFTKDEERMAHDHALIRSDNDHVLPNLDRMSDALMYKMKGVYPEYNPFADIITLWNQPSVHYYKEQSSVAGLKRIIPFSNENGDSIFQYACVIT